MQGDPKREPGALTIRGLADALRAALGRKKLDVLGMDSCLMSTAEVCRQVRARVNYFVASEGFVPNTGWPYRDMLDKLTHYYKGDPPRFPAHAELRPEILCERLVKDYIEYYRDYLPAGVSVDIAACDLSKFDEINESVHDAGRAASRSY